MAHELAKTTQERMAVLEKVVVEGDLSKLYAGGAGRLLPQRLRGP